MFSENAIDPDSNTTLNMANNNNDDLQISGEIPIAPPPFDPTNLLQMIGVMIN